MNFKQIATYDNYMLANMTMGLLTENGIKCQMKDEHIVTIDPLLNPAVGGIKLLVEENDFDRAVDLMKEAEADYLKDIACPRCKSHSLMVEEKTNNPSDFWGRIKNQVYLGKHQRTAKDTVVQPVKNILQSYLLHFKIFNNSAYKENTTQSTQKGWFFVYFVKKLRVLCG